MEKEKSRITLKTVLIIVLLLFTFTAGRAYSAVFYVAPNGAGENCTQENPCSFQKALNKAAESSENDTIYLNPGVYYANETGTFSYSVSDNSSGSLAIIGMENGSEEVVLEGGGTTGIMKIIDKISNGTILIKNVVFRNGSEDYGAGLYVKVEAADVTIENSRFEHNTADDKYAVGGGVCVHTDSGNVTIKNSRFEHNTAHGENVSGGGAYVYTYNGNVTIENSRFDHNTALGGGGVFVDSKNGSVIIENSQFENNNALGGGGVFVDSKNGSVIIENSQFENNVVDDGGGVFVDSKNGSVIIKNSQFENNNACNGGGVSVDSENGSVIIKNSQFENNVADYGGGVSVDSENGSVTIENNSFYSNNATSKGGAVRIYVDGNLNLYNNIFWSNGISDGGEGGDVYVRGGSLNIYNNDFSCNDFSGNGTCLKLNDYSSYNQGSNMSVDPLFVDPDNGDLHLKPPSPCIDAGNNTAPGLPLLKKDMDGESRIMDGNGDGVPTVDIGADEFNPAPKIDNFAAAPTQGVVPLEVVFSFKAHDPNGETVTCTLSFGDGNTYTYTGEEGNVTHVYEDPGVYNATLIAEDSSGNKVQSNTVQIAVGQEEYQRTSKGEIKLVTRYSEVENFEVAEPECEIPEGLQAVYGQMSFTLNLPEGADVEEVALVLPESVERFNVFKCVDGKLKDVTEEVKKDKNKIAFTIQDNGQFDEDEREGVIKDPVIIAEEIQGSSSSSNHVGCSLSEVSARTGLFNLLLMLSGFVGIAVRRRK